MRDEANEDDVLRSAEDGLGKAPTLPALADLARWLEIFRRRADEAADR